MKKKKINKYKFGNHFHKQIEIKFVIFYDDAEIKKKTESTVGDLSAVQVNDTNRPPLRPHLQLPPFFCNSLINNHFETKKNKS